MDMNISKDLEYVIAALPSFGSRYAYLVMGYAQLFGITPMQVKAKKLRLIITAMKTLFDSESFTWEKKLYPISHAGIAEALDIMIKRNFIKHLTNHNYLKTIMIDISEREGKEKSRTAEKDLHKKEANLQGGNREESPALIPCPQGRKEQKNSCPLRGEDKGGGVNRTGQPAPLSAIAQQAVAELKKKWGEK